jgi:hypothetical protein
MCSALLGLFFDLLLLGLILSGSAPCFALSLLLALLLSLLPALLLLGPLDPLSVPLPLLLAPILLCQLLNLPLLTTTIRHIDGREVTTTRYW